MSRVSHEAPGQSHGKLPELSTLFAEILFVVSCSVGQLLFAIVLANTLVNQITLIDALGLAGSKSPWLIGSFCIANGVSVVVSGSLADLTNPKWLDCECLGLATVWNLIGIFSITPSRMVLHFVVRAMIGLSVSMIQSTAVSMLGRIYKPRSEKDNGLLLDGCYGSTGIRCRRIAGRYLQRTSSLGFRLYGHCVCPLHSRCILGGSNPAAIVRSGR